jgi:hypothetical protein
MNTIHRYVRVLVASGLKGNSVSPVICLHKMYLCARWPYCIQPLACDLVGSGVNIKTHQRLQLLQGTCRIPRFIKNICMKFTSRLSACVLTMLMAEFWRTSSSTSPSHEHMEHSLNTTIAVYTPVQQGLYTEVSFVEMLLFAATVFGSCYYLVCFHYSICVSSCS